MLRRSRPSITSLVLRWLVLVVSALIVFRRLSVSLLVEDVGANAGLSYLVVVPVLAVLAAVAVHRRGRPVVEIHDRETDIIVGGFALVITISAAVLLTPELGVEFHLWRIDLLLLWAFALSAAILLFGLRRAIQYRLAWLVLLLLWPLPLRMLVFTVGKGNLIAIEIVLLVVAVLVVTQGARRGERWWPLPVVLALVGAPLVAVMPIYRLSILTVVPAATVSALALLWWGLVDRGRPQTVLRKPVVTRPWTSYGALVVASAISLVLVPAAPPVVVPQVPTGAIAAQQRGDGVPPGWRLLARSDHPEESVYFGRGSIWQRSQLEAKGIDTAPEAVDEKGVRRQAMVDELSTQRIRTLTIFPLQTTYGVAGTGVTRGEPVDLGHGVVGSLHAGVDLNRNLTWTVVTFTVLLPSDRAPRAMPDPQGQVAQRITVLLVDDHRPGAFFPEPSNAILASVRATLRSILRGTGRVESATPKTPDLAVALARQLLDQKVGEGS